MNSDDNILAICQVTLQINKDQAEQLKIKLANEVIIYGDSVTVITLSEVINRFSQI